MSSVIPLEFRAQRVNILSSRPRGSRGVWWLVPGGVVPVGKGGGWEEGGGGWEEGGGDRASCFMAT